MPSLPLILMLLAAALTAADHIPSTGPSKMEKVRQRQAGDRLLADLAAACARGDRAFSVPTGQYRFSRATKQGAHNSFLVLRGVADLTIDGGGSTFWMEDCGRAFHIMNSRGLTIRNLDIDWDPLPFTQGTVVGVDAETSCLEVRLDPAYARVSPAFAALPPDPDDRVGTVRGAIFPPDSPRFKTGQVGFRVVPFFRTAARDGIFRIRVLTFRDRPLAAINAVPGDRIALWIRNGGGFLIEGSERVTIEDVNLHACSGFGFVEYGGVGGNVFRRCRITPRPGTIDLMGGNCDGFHSAHSGQGPLIEDCEAESLGDDAVNIHGGYVRVEAQGDPDQILIGKPPGRGDLAGTTAVVIAPESAGFALRGRRAVRAATPQGAGLSLRLDGPLSVQPGDFCAIEERSGQGAAVRGCAFRNILTRGVLLKTHHATVADNRIDGTGSWGIVLTAEPGYWGESMLPHHVAVTGNTVSDAGMLSSPSCEIGLMAVGDPAVAERIADIAVERNRLIRTSGPAIRVKNGVRLRIVGNTIAGRTDPAADPASAIAVEHGDEVLLDGNRFAP